MPNYTLTPRVISSMTDRATKLIERRKAVMSEDFPLTLDEVQTGLLAPEVREAVDVLRSHGSVMTMFRTTRLVDAVIPDTNSIIHMKFSRELCYSTWTTSGKHEFFVDHLDPKKRLRLNEWCAKAAQEFQIADLTYRVVKSYLARDLTITVAHVLAQWPTLSLLVTDLPWTERFNSPVKITKRYQWQVTDDHWLAKYRKAMKLADMVLTSAVMLPEPSSNARHEVVAHVTGIVK